MAMIWETALELPAGLKLLKEGSLGKFKILVLPTLCFDELQYLVFLKNLKHVLETC